MTTLEIVITGVVPLGRFATRLKLQPRANATGKTYGRPVIFRQERISHFLTDARGPNSRTMELRTGGATDTARATPL